MIPRDDFTIIVQCSVVAEFSDHSALSKSHGPKVVLAFLTNFSHQLDLILASCFHDFWKHRQSCNRVSPMTHGLASTSDVAVLRFSLRCSHL